MGLGFNQEFDLGCLLLDLGTYRKRTVDTEILVLIPLR